jgi:type IV secretory pathway VirB6-like protein
LLHKLKTVLVSSILVTSFFFSSTQNASAVIDRVRDAHIDGGGGCSTASVKFDPVLPTDDLLWELDNPVCIAYGLGVGITLIGTEMAANYMCNSTDLAKAAQASKETIELAAAKFAGFWLTLKTIKRTISGVASCGTYTSECLASSGASFRCVQAAACCSGLVAKVAAFAAAMAELKIIHQAAVDSQENAHICGETWNTWEERPAAQLDESDGEGISGYQEGTLPDNKFYVYGKKAHSSQKALEDKYQAGLITPDITNKEYREYLYGGIEKEDNDNSYGGCSLPNWDNATLDKILGYHDGNQRYYMRGPKIASNYACGRFLLYKGSAKNKKSARDAYECCKQRSQETICIEEGNALAGAIGGLVGDSTDSALGMAGPIGGVSGAIGGVAGAIGGVAGTMGRAAAIGGLVGDSTDSALGVVGLKTKYKFCKLGERCKVQNVWYEIHPAKAIPNYICATTYSVCPYNHNLGGGTEIAEYAPQHQDILTNHCQYLKHCVKVPDVPYIRTSDLDGGWFDSACFDLKGDSQNNYGFTAQLLPINTKNFSAPIAQCFKETLENVFINKAGHTTCLDPEESPNKDNICSSGYLFREGSVIEGQKSFFQSIQDHLQTAIKMVMTIAVTIMGIGVLLTGKTWDKKTLIMFIIKLGLVAFFALGTAWQDTFFVGVSRTSMVLADIFMEVDVSKLENKRDGCQFPKYNAQIMKDDGVMDVANASYPKGREYLAIWDMLDCKIARALGFGLEASVPNLIYMILAGFLTGGLGIIFFVGVFIFAFYLIALTVRALHIFLISSIAITILIYISPITITTCLFKRTEGVFKKWRTNLISFVLQPVILFCYLGIVITIFEATIIGDATFSGDGINTPKQIVCSTGNAANNSIYCIFKINKVKTMNALAPLGIGLPVLLDMDLEKMATISKGAFLMFIFTKFLDQITKLASAIVGGSELKSGSSGALAALGKAHGITKAVQSRGKNATQKFGGKIAKGVGSAIKKGVGAAGRKGVSAPKDDAKSSARSKVNPDSSPPTGSS